MLNWTLQDPGITVQIGQGNTGLGQYRALSTRAAELNTKHDELLAQVKLDQQAMDSYI